MNTKYLSFVLLTALSLPCLAQGSSESTVSKNKLNVTYSAKDTITQESDAYGLTWNIAIDHKPVDFLDNKYQFSVDLSAEVSETESSTEKTDIDKYGAGLKFAATENSNLVKPFVSLGIESIKESKVSATETIRGKFDGTFKWGAGFTFPLIDQKPSTLEHKPILGLEIGYFRNYDKFPFDDKVFAETKITIVFDVFTLFKK